MKFQVKKEKLNNILKTLKEKEKNNLPKLKIHNLEEFSKMITNTNVFEHICVIGDYDVDGVMATAISLKCLKMLGFKKTSAILPNRFTDGYGLSKKLVDRAYKNNVKTIITVDNGIREFESIEYAKSLGLRVIVTDHHTPPTKIPNADLICSSHFGEGVDICGAMLIYQLFKPLIEKTTSVLLHNELKVFAGFATIADCMPLINENKELVKETIRIIRDSEFDNEFILSIMANNSVKTRFFDAETIGFSMVPILNSSGRLDTAFWSLNALLEPNDLLIDKLSDFNKERKRLSAKYVNLAKEQLNDDDLINVICLNEIEEGIIGIVAGKICESTDKPTFIFTEIEGDFIKGSGRSPEYFNLIEGAEFLNKKDYNVKFGGHSGAMGLTLKTKECLEDFKKEFTKELKQVKEKDTVVLAYEWLDEFNLEKVRESFDEFEPFGFMNGEPLFCKTLMLEDVKAIGELKNHFAFKTTLNGEKVRGTYFFADKVLEQNKEYKMFFTLKRDENYLGEEIVSLKVKYVY